MKKQIYMFTRGHYNYLLDTIIEDPILSSNGRRIIAQNLHDWFKRDFPNFNSKNWREQWEKKMPHVPSLSD